MLRDPKVIEHLNTQLTNELTAVNQYFLHARALEHWGVTKLGKYEYAESIGEMKHADELIKRILFLDGLPNVQRLNPIQVGEDVEQILKADMALEEKALTDLREGIAYCESVRDFVSRELEQCGMKADGVALALQNNTLKIVVENHSRRTSPHFEGLDMAAQKVLHACIEEEAQEDLARIAQHHDEGHQWTACAADLEMSEVGPVRLGLFTR